MTNKDFKDFKHFKYFFIYSIVLFILERAIVFINFSKRYTDIDQLILWNVAKDLLHGIYRGPCFYGQNYNPNFEAVFALPFLKMGMQYATALPLVTMFMGSMPFLILTFIFYKSEYKILALIPLVIANLLPVEFIMLSSIPRGFVSGIFFVMLSFGIVSLRQSKIKYVVAGLLCIMGLYANLNSLLLAPIFLPKVLELFNAKQWNLLICIVLGTLIGSLAFWYNANFYLSHPENITHPGISLELSLANYAKVFSKLDNYFNFITPIFWKGGWLMLLVFPFATVYFYKKKNLVSMFITLSFFLILNFSFLINKTTEASNSLFFSGARMFLAFPLVLIFVSFYVLQTDGKPFRKWMIGLVWFSLLTNVGKNIAMSHLIAQGMGDSENNKIKNKLMAIKSIDELRIECAKIKKMTSGKNSIVLGLAPLSYDAFVPYGCDCLFDDFPQTNIPLFDRRFWLKSEILHKVYSHILIKGDVESQWKFVKIDSSKIVLSDKQSHLLFLENSMRLDTFLKHIDLHFLSQAEKDKFENQKNKKENISN